MTYEIKFKVVGKHQFPSDMLRTDDCRPASEQDEAAIARKTVPFRHRDDAREQVEISLIHVSSRRHWEPCFDRWSSFSWPVVRDSVEVRECTK